MHPEVLALKEHQFCAGMGKDCINGTVECQQKECRVRDYPKLKQTLEEVEEYVNQLEVLTHIKEDILNILKKTEELEA